ncbi:MAG: 3-phosphoshikimate 1-carboxyvinyltransferase [Bacteroidales bacterium]
MRTHSMYSVQTKYRLSFPHAKLCGCVEIPASKSISNRLLILNCLTKEKTKIVNLSSSADTKLMQNLCAQLPHVANSEIPYIFNCNNAGTVLRFLTPILAITKGNWIITGSARMQQRPVGALVDALRSMGAQITYMQQAGFPPLQIQGCDLKTKKVCVDASLSSQFVSALMLLAATSLSKPFEIILTEKQNVSLPYIAMTASLLQLYGLNVNVSDHKIYIEGVFQKCETYTVEADWTSASYLYALLALAQDGNLFLPNFYKNSLQGDQVLVRWAALLGVDTLFKENGIQLTKKTMPLPLELTLNFADNPDLVQTMAVLCAGLGIVGHFSGLQALKHKETDRIQALVYELRKMGVCCQTDGNTDLHILSKIQNTAVCIDTYDDHRMAMAFAVLSIKYPGIQINHPEVVEKSFENYWDCLRKLGAEISLR